MVEDDKKWVADNMVLRSEIEQLENQQDPRVDDVRATLELLNRAPDLYRRQSDFERARLLRALIWNLTLTAESVDPVYRKPFDLIAEGVTSANWCPLVDKFGTFQWPKARHLQDLIVGSRT
jgi:hypothetical protein